LHFVLNDLGYVKVLHLKHNNCLENSSEEDRNFASWLLDVGNRRHPITSRENAAIELNPEMKCGDDTTSLIPAISWTKHN